jgi:hypothetical protein
MATATAPTDLPIASFSEALVMLQSGFSNGQMHMSSSPLRAGKRWGSKGFVLGFDDSWCLVGCGVCQRDVLRLRAPNRKKLRSATGCRKTM